MVTNVLQLSKTNTMNYDFYDMNILHYKNNI